MANDYVELLAALDGIAQDPRHHPEGDALFHSLQVFAHARSETRDSELVTAALLHDCGKAIRSRDHDRLGAELLDGLVSPRVVWLVRHHLDLLREPARTRRRLRGTPELRDLELLRSWDLRGRSPWASVCSIEEAATFTSLPPPPGALTGPYDPTR
ncbi:MAG: hypothetical protein AMXMBFR23_28550 [Chloroflexota bacterium]